MCSAIHHESFTLSFWDFVRGLGVLGIDTNHHEALVAAFTVNNKVLCLSPKILTAYARIYGTRAA